MRLASMCLLLSIIFSAAIPATSFSAPSYSYDQALFRAKKEVRSIGYNPASMKIEAGDESVVAKMRNNGDITYNAIFTKDWYPFHFCQNDGVANTCVWVLVSKSDEDTILW